MTTPPNLVRRWRRIPAKTVLDSVLDPAEVKVLSGGCVCVFCNLQIPCDPFLFESNRRHQTRKIHNVGKQKVDESAELVGKIALGWETGIESHPSRKSKNLQVSG